MLCRWEKNKKRGAFFRPQERDLLVGQDEDRGLCQLLVVQHVRQLLAGLADSLLVGRVHHEDDPLGVLVVVPPQLADLLLASNVPHREGDVTVLDLLHVEACGKRATGGKHKEGRGSVRVRREKGRKTAKNERMKRNG